MVDADRSGSCGAAFAHFLSAWLDSPAVSSPLSLSCLAPAFVRRRPKDVFLAIASPLDAFAGLLLQVHMVQHLFLMLLAPPLILAGAPYLPILSGLPRVFTREVLGPILCLESDQAYRARLV